MGDARANEIGAAFDLRVLGHGELVVDGAPVALSRAEVLLLTALAIEAARVVSIGNLEDVLWPEARPATAHKSLQNHIVRLRRKLGAASIRTQPDGYLLDIEPQMIDIVRFERHTTIALDRARPIGERLTAARDALANWPGTGPSILEQIPRLWPELTRVREQRLDVEEAQVELSIRAGQFEAAIHLSERLVAQGPYREYRWWLQMVALVRAGRRRDALNTYARARQLLIDDIGIEPGHRLRSLQQIILDDDLKESDDLLFAARSDEGDRMPAHEHFVGRAAEIARLEVALREAREHGPKVIAVAGEAGIGKSALMQQFASRQPAGNVLFGACHRATSAPLEPFIAAIEHLQQTTSARVFRRLAADDPDAIAWLVPSAVDTLSTRRAIPDVEITRERVDDAVIALLRAASKHHVVALVIEDLHWAGPSTVRLLRQLATDSATRLLIVATHRAFEPVDAHVDVLLKEFAGNDGDSRIELPGLTEIDLREYLVGLLGDAGDATGAAEWLFGRTEGHALFVHELTAHLLQERSFVERDGRWQVGRDDTNIPASLRTAISRRVDALGADVVRVLQIAAIAGPLPEIDTVEQIAGPSRQALRDARALGLISLTATPHRSVAFTHDLIRRYLYDLTPEGRRIELHELTADVLEIGPHERRSWVRIADHRVIAAALDLRRAIDACRRAGDELAGRFDHETAAQWYDEGLRLLGDNNHSRDTEIGCDLLLAKGDVLRRAGRAENVEVLLDAAAIAARIGDVDRRARCALALCELGHTTHAGAVDSHVNDLVTEALATVRDPTVEVMLASAAAVLYSLTPGLEASSGLFDRAERTARALGDPGTLARALSYGFLGLCRPDEFERREQVGRELTALGRQLGDPVAAFEGLHIEFSTRLQRADRNGCIEAHRGMVEVADLLREPIRWWTTAYQAAALAQIDGDLDTADGEIHRCFTIGQSVSASRNLAVYGSQLLGIRLDQGRTNELLGIIDAAVAAQPLMAWRCAMAIAAAQSRDLDRSRQELEVICANDLSGLTRDIAWLGGMFAVASAAASTDDREHAELAYRHLAPFAGRMSWQGTTTYGAVDYALGALAFTIGDHEVARHHLQVAHDLSCALRAPLHELRTTIALAACGDTAAAHEVDAALEEATRQGWLGVVNDAELVWRVR
ncbi:MAG: BTAD domain-containing putative transcriptional regulator [Acidimicrobiales bacterium]